MVVVTGHVASVTFPDFAWLSAEHIPDREPLAVLVGGTLNLVAGGGDTPYKVFWETRKNPPRWRLFIIIKQILIAKFPN